MAKVPPYIFVNALPPIRGANMPKDQVVVLIIAATEEVAKTEAKRIEGFYASVPQIDVPDLPRPPG